MRATWTKQIVGIALTAVCAAGAGRFGQRHRRPTRSSGTWKLDVAKSTYKPGPAPKSVTVVIERQARRIKVAVDGVAG